MVTQCSNALPVSQRRFPFAKIPAVQSVVQTVNGIRNLHATLPGSVLTIGNFDGVHLGHRELISRVVRKARALGIPAVVMTFEPHPVKVLYPDRHLHRIFALEDQSSELEKLGVDYLVTEPFSREFSQVEPERYVREWIYRPFTPETLVVGYDFSFGAYRKGSIDFLNQHLPALGCQVEVVAPVKVDSVVVSSTRIRQALEVGDVALAAKLLGRQFYLKGIVERGAGRGRNIGYPTANLNTNAETWPARGVYAGWVDVWSGHFPAAINIGFNPTFAAKPGAAGETRGMTVEAHIINTGPDTESAALNLYGETVSIRFLERLRSEKKFGGVSELLTQIKHDVASALKMLEGADEISRPKS